ncbi:UNVERIFIED_CONTAM: hypothetical protein PYX00_006714 [Menopon gallinae]|uniref:F-box domain-containing protein n=1 Tax=Menopon gallinae TaxID=328185 RepID=A0AAW2HXG6_9NEOP
MSSPEENLRKKTIDDLPDEILEYILSLVSPYKDSESCREVSRRWCRTINSVNQHSKCDLYRSVLNSSVLWQCIVPPNLGPTTTITKRYSHAACYCDNFMYVFGGCTLRCTMFNDLWTLDLSSRKWIRPYSTGCYPSPKACATICCYNKSLILFGGWTHPPPYPLHQIQRLFNELHIYDITSNTWNIIHSPVTPPPMAGHSATIHGNNMVVFGGLQWGGSLFLYSSSNDVWCFNFETLCWSKPETSEEKPKTRYGQSQIYLDDENMMIMGGCQGPNSILDDVWILTITKSVWVWKQLKVNNSQWAAPLLWCHPACRVGDVVVVFSCGPSQALSHYSSCSPVRTSPPPPQDASIPPEVVARQASQGPLPNEKDVNVNGQRGSLGKNKSSLDASASSSSSSGYRGTIGGCLREQLMEMSVFQVRMCLIQCRRANGVGSRRRTAALGG